MNGQILQPYVNLLRGIVADAWARCILDYFQLVTLRLVDQYSAQSYIDSCLNDSAEFNNFTRQLLGPEFRPKQVWRAWGYIRELVIKYRPGDMKINVLDAGTRESVRFKLSQFLSGNPPKATVLMDRPERTVTETEWNRLPQRSLNSLFAEATEMCGREVVDQSDWKYTDVFVEQSPRLQAIFA